MGYARNILIAVDQLCNTVAGGWPDETLSSRAFRWSRDNVRHWPRLCIDGLFFWDRDRTTGQRHCELSWISEKDRLQLAPEFRR